MSKIEAARGVLDLVRLGHDIWRDRQDRQERNAVEARDKRIRELEEQIEKLRTEYP